LGGEEMQIPFTLKRLFEGDTGCYGGQQRIGSLEYGVIGHLSIHWSKFAGEYIRQMLEDV